MRRAIVVQQKGLCKRFRIKMRAIFLILSDLANVSILRSRRLLLEIRAYPTLSAPSVLYVRRNE